VRVRGRRDCSFRKSHHKCLAAFRATCLQKKGDNSILLCGELANHVDEALESQWHATSRYACYGFVHVSWLSTL
jgi:hypothetical protein